MRAGPRPRRPRHDWRRFLLAGGVEAYGDLDPAQQERLQALLTTEQYQEVRPFMITTYERGIQQGIQRGQRQLVLRQLEAKFGPLTPEVKQRVEALSTEQLDQLALDFVKAQSLKDLRLEDGVPPAPPA